MSRPCAFSSAARAVTASVGDGLMRSSAVEKNGMAEAPWIPSGLGGHTARLKPFAAALRNMPYG